MRRGEDEYAHWNDMVAAATKPTNTTVPSYAQVVGAVNQAAADTDLALTAAGGFPGELCKNWRVKRPGTFDCEFGFSCMGYEIAGAWGAKMADESRDVLCFIGDGSYLMMNSDIYSTVLTGHKLIVIVCDNGGFAVINRLQNFKGVPSFNNQIEDCKIVREVDVDFAAHAASMGALTRTVESLTDLDDAIRWAENDRPHHSAGDEDRRLHLDAGRRLVGRRRAGSFHPRLGEKGTQGARRGTQETAGGGVTAAVRKAPLRRHSPQSASAESRSAGFGRRNVMA